MSTPAREAVEALCDTLESFTKAYPEDIFGPVTDKEREEHGSLITRNSAAMGRHCAKFMGEAAAMLRSLLDAPGVPAREPRGWAMKRSFADGGKGVICYWRAEGWEIEPIYDLSSPDAAPSVAESARPFDKIGADRLADEVAALITRGVLDQRSPVADALLDYRSPPRTPRSDALAESATPPVPPEVPPGYWDRLTDHMGALKPAAAPAIAPDALTDALPCPFCGATPEVNEWPDYPRLGAQVACTNDACEVSAHTDMESGCTRAYAIATWNRRAAMRAATGPEDAGLCEDLRHLFAHSRPDWLNKIKERAATRIESLSAQNTAKDELLRRAYAYLRDEGIYPDICQDIESALAQGNPGAPNGK